MDFVVVSFIVVLFPLFARSKREEGVDQKIYERVVFVLAHMAAVLYLTRHGKEIEEIILQLLSIHFTWQMPAILANEIAKRIKRN